MGYPIRWDEISAPEEHESVLQQEVKASLSLRPYFRKVIALTLAGSSILVLTVVGVTSVKLDGGQPAALQLESVPEGTQAAAATPRVIRRVGYVTVAGSVTNRTAATLDRVEAVVELLDRERHALRSESSMIARNSIAPGQISAFQVEMADDPRAVAYRFHFKKLYGADLR